MKLIGLLISLLLHAGLILLAVTWAVSPPLKISLDMPVYQVDLVSLAPLPAAPAVKKAPPAEVKPQLSKPAAVAIPETAPKAVPETKPEVEKAPPAKPKPVAKPKPKPEAKPISEKKVKTTTPPKKPAEEKPVKKEEPAKKEPEKKAPPKKVEPKKPEVKAEDALAADLASLAKIVEKKEKAERQAVASDLASLVDTAKTTAVSGSPDGTAGASGLVQVYASIVKEAVRKNWRYPVFGQKENLVTQVQIQLKASGEISDIEILSSSGNTDFDDSVLTALRDTEVLPEPPGTSIRTIIVNFNLHDLDQ
ncbi:energy transducer TonB [Maridesulfovibrio sp. FT414]|uniref:cell envelope integrity protein TolA n=1 Tax=Maridesulfovibrio sp. FT414 TaxID=2979469 RepID=UPI003D80421C